MFDEEEWRYVPNFPEYIISNFGNIRKTGSNRGRPLEKTITAHGVFVNLHVNDEVYRFKLARLVAAAFLYQFGSTPMLGELSYIDGDPTNCRADNLVWSE